MNNRHNNELGNEKISSLLFRMAVPAITAQITKGKLPTHVELQAAECALERDSVVLLEQLRTIDKRRLKEKITVLQDKFMVRVDQAMGISVGLVKF